eukprot:129322-Rhodomonas_salina.2
MVSAGRGSKQRARISLESRWSQLQHELRIHLIRLVHNNLAVAAPPLDREGRNHTVVVDRALAFVLAATFAGRSCCSSARLLVGDEERIADAHAADQDEGFP